MGVVAEQDQVAKAVNSPMAVVWLMVIIFVIYSFSCSGPSKPDPKYAEAEQKLQAAREEGARASAAADDAIRANNEMLRQRMEAAAIYTKVINDGPVMTVGYEMKDHRVIICTTTVYPSGAPIMQCDGEP